MNRNWKTVLAEHERVVAGMGEMAPVLDRTAEAIIACLRAGKRVFVFGNGGSAADAQHIAAELLGRFRLERRALPVVALTTNASALTAIGNDLGFERVFARQLEGLVGEGDVAWALSTSGKSPNVLAGVRVAAERGAITIGFIGQSGGKLAELCTHVLQVPHDDADRIQEAHALAYHYVCERVEAGMAE
jgi:D-sedoheptulose 7-phosphate isomerase